MARLLAAALVLLAVSARAAEPAPSAECVELNARYQKLYGRMFKTLEEIQTMNRIEGLIKTKCSPKPPAADKPVADKPADPPAPPARKPTPEEEKAAKCAELRKQKDAAMKSPHATFAIGLLADELERRGCNKPAAKKAKTAKR